MAESLLKLLESRVTLSDFVKDLKSNAVDSERAGLQLASEMKKYGIKIQDYIRLKVDLNKDEEGAELKKAGMDAYEAVLYKLSLPVKNDYKNGVVLAQASETFQSYPGTRILFQPVIDEILRFTTRMDNIERVSDIVGSSRVVSGIEMISIVAESDEDAESTFSIAEGANIPIRKIKTKEQAVKWFKHGSGYEYTYEFDRRASLDIFTPYAARIVRRLEMSKVAAATNILINGDGVHSPAPVVKQSDLMKRFDSSAVNTPNEINYGALLAWFLDMAKKGTPIDTVIGNYDTYLMWMMLFTPTLGSTSQAQAMVNAGGPNLTASIPGLFVPVKFVVSSTMPAKQLLGFIKAETLQELVEEGSQISESETYVRSQRIAYYRTETTGYKLVFGDTRSIYNVGA